MRVLSIDVGIKNLAYCLFDVVNDKNFHIEDWEVINLCEDNKKNCCEMVGKNRETHCSKVATYFKDEAFYCKLHAKKRDWLVPPSTTALQIKRMPVDEICQLLDDLMIEYSKPIKKSKLIKTYENYVNTRCFNCVKETKAGDMSLIDVGKGLVQKFSARFPWKIDVVLIENQVSPIANRMKTIQGMIAQYFIMKDSDIISFIAACNKLKYYTNGEKTSYNERKKMGVEITSALLTNNYQLKDAVPMLMNTKKKDDLCDSFLQGIWYMEENKIITKLYIN